MKKMKKYAPANCYSIEDVKEGLNDLYQRQYNYKTTGSKFVTELTIKAYNVRLNQLELVFDCEKYYNSLTN